VPVDPSKRNANSRFLLTMPCPQLTLDDPTSIGAFIAGVVVSIAVVAGAFSAIGIWTKTKGEGMLPTPGWPA
jgi:hypothetical protein